ncbi:Two-component sensor PilS [gamma proteobacterium IMCC1989]|nr:Two-component sensor PilS [gamma proteobacterium IMCC1989]
MHNNNASSENTRLFTVYIYYRLAMGVLLAALFLSGLGQEFLGAGSPTVFIYTSYIYIGFCLFSLALMLMGVLKAKSAHIIFLLVIDFVALIQMIYTSDSMIGGLGYLLLIPMAIGGTFLRGKTSVALAAFASLLILFNSLLNSLDSTNNNQYLFTAGLTGTALFIAAIVFRLLSKKLEKSEFLIEKQVQRAEYLQNISQRIIETIQAGIVVIDHQQEVLLINNAAEKLLSENTTFRQPQDIPALKSVLTAWQQKQVPPNEMTINMEGHHEIRVSFTQLPDPQINALMLFIEDEKRINQEAQQIKLASLGRLTSSIAHEIRNPLGAISHASQLLDESEYIHRSDQELLRMIQVNSQRIDQTINNILQFSRRKQSSPEMINLCEWVSTFCSNYQSQHTSQIICSMSKDHIYGRIDPNHLQQIITNLVDNGIRHGKKQNTKGVIYINVGINEHSKLPYIDVLDEGDGIKDTDLNQIFEPFFTTKTSGSGLGLYLCKELCEANKADILYLQKTDTQKSCFRLTFNDSKQKNITDE